MNLNLSFLFIFILSASSCSWFRSSDTVPAPKSVPLVESPKEDPIQKIWIVWAKVLGQAQAVEREAWWVLTDQKTRGVTGTFSRLQRAIEKQISGLKKNKVLRCEQFEMRKDILDPVRLYMKGQLFESCVRPAHLILDFEFVQPRALKLMINPEFQADVYGLGSAILNKNITCELTWTEKEVLHTLQCKGYKRNRSEKEIVELDRFEYTADAEQLLILSGKVTENLLPSRKIDAKVPLSGKITVTEIEIEKPKPPGYTESAGLQKAPETRGPRDTVSGPESAGAIPDMLKRRSDEKLKNFTPPAAGESVRNDGMPGPIESSVENPEGAVPQPIDPLAPATVKGGPLDRVQGNQQEAPLQSGGQQDLSPQSGQQVQQEEELPAPQNEEPQVQQQKQPQILKQAEPEMHEIKD